MHFGWIHDFTGSYGYHLWFVRYAAFYYTLLCFSFLFFLLQIKWRGRWSSVHTSPKRDYAVLWRLWLHVWNSLRLSNYASRIFLFLPLSTANPSLWLSEPQDKDGMQMVSMPITPDDVTLLFDRCGDRSLSTRKQVRRIICRCHFEFFYKIDDKRVPTSC